MMSFQVAEFNAPERGRAKNAGADRNPIRVKAAGVCHSDLHIREGGYDMIWAMAASRCR